MWYEILPSFLIITACLGMTGVANFGSKYFWNGSIHGRSQYTLRTQYLWDRDETMVGRPRKSTLGLDGLTEQ